MVNGRASRFAIRSSGRYLNDPFRVQAIAELDLRACEHGLGRKYKEKL